MSRSEIELLNARLDLHEGALNELRNDFGTLINAFNTYIKENLETSKLSQEQINCQKEVNAIQGEHSRQSIADMVILLNFIGHLGHILITHTDIKAADMLHKLTVMKATFPPQIVDNATAFNILESIWKQLVDIETKGT